MTAQSNLAAALLEVRAYLVREAQAEEFRNDAAWESGSSREERAAIDALARLDEALRQLRTQERPERAGGGSGPRGHDRPRPPRAEMAA